MYNEVPEKRTVCPYCKRLNDCPRKDELDEFGDPVRLFATECKKWQPYYDNFYCDNKPSALFIETSKICSSKIY
jgi:hypothetical protein